MDLKSLTRQQVYDLADSDKIFERGQGYYRSDAIVRCTVSEDALTAKVRGNYGLYTVKVEGTPEGLDLECDCPYDGAVCKHIVAVLLRYLGGDCEEVPSPASGVPHALEQTLEALSHRALLDLILNLAGERADFRSVLLANVNIPAQVVQQQPRQAQQVQQFKEEVGDFFNALQYHDAYDGYDTAEEYAGLDAVFEVTTTLNPEDQLEIFWHVVTCGNELFEDYPADTEPIEQALELYAAAAGHLNLTYQDKQTCFDTLLDALRWEMCGYGDVTEAIKGALDALCAEPEDYRYLIEQLEQGHVPGRPDWIASYYLKLGDEENYLRVRQAHLDYETQYLELAQYWERKGEEEKRVAVLESYVSKLLQQAEPRPHFTYRPTAEPGGVLETLAQHYLNLGDDENLCRVLMVEAQHERLTLALYRQIEAVSAKLKKWQEAQKTLIKLAKRDTYTLAEITLYEQDWEAAIALTRQAPAYDFGGERVKVLVAEGVKKQRPKAAVEIYQRLAQHYIDEKSRQHYRTAANYAKKIKSVYLSLLNDEKAWQHYLDELRERYPRHRALQDEFKNL